MANEITPYQLAPALDLVAIRANSDYYPRLRDFAPESARGTLAQIVAMAYTYTGRRFDDNELRFVASSLYNELMADNDRCGTANITPQEVAHAIRQAIIADSLYGVNVASLYKAVRTYCLGEGQDAQRAANARKTEERRKALGNTPAGALLATYAGKLLESSNTTEQ